MKKVETVIGTHYTILCVIFYSIVLLVTCSCSTRKKNTELIKDNSSSSSEAKVNLTESITDKGTIEKLFEENNWTITVKEIFGQLPDNSNLSGNYPISKETTYTKTSKKSIEKEQKHLTSNKALQSTEKKKEVSSYLGKKKTTEKTGVGTGKVIGITIIVAFSLMAIWAIKRQLRVKNLL